MNRQYFLKQLVRLKLVIVVVLIIFIFPGILLSVPQKPSKAEITESVQAEL